MRDELYINNQRVDMSESGINLTFRSNLLSDISKIVSNYSYTIKLPKTANNLRIISGAVFPSSESSFPYLVHAGRVLRDGIVIVGDADVFLLANDEEQLEICLNWNGLYGFESIKEKNLRDLPYSIDVDYLPWAAFSSKTQPEVDYGDATVYLNPVINLGWILRRIEQQSGIKFIYPDEKYSLINDELVIPLITRNGSEEYTNQFKGKIDFANYNEKEETSAILHIDSNYNTDYGFLSGQTEELFTTYVPKVNGSALRLSGTLKIVLNTSTQPSNIRKMNLSLCRKDDPSSIALSVYPDSISRYGALFAMDYVLRNVESDMLGRDVPYQFRIMNLGAYNITRVDGSFDITPFDKEVQPGSKLFIVPNLPDMKQVDFLKGVFQMLGLFVIASGKGQITVASFNDLHKNKKNAYDWSEKVCSKLPVFGRTTYKLDDVARNNLFKYKDDDTVYGDYSANIQVDNKTLEYEREAVTLPFAASDQRGGLAYIPINIYNNNGSGEYRIVEPRIIRRILDGGTYKGTFTGLEWPSLIEKYYNGYEKLLDKSKVLEIVVKLSPVDLKILDMTKPVYLKQYGACFAILEIKTGDNNLCDVKLLKL